MYVKFMFFKKATKIDAIFTVDLTLCSKCQMDGEDFVNFCGLLKKHELYIHSNNKYTRRTNIQCKKTMILQKMKILGRQIKRKF